jgi:DNA-binding protein Fis
MTFLKKSSQNKDESASTMCTVVICHGSKTKQALFDILKRMECEVCEITSLTDLLHFLGDSNFTYLEFADNPAVDTPRSYVVHTLNSAQETLVNSVRQPRRDISDTQYFTRKTDNMTLVEIEEIHIRNTLKRCRWVYKDAAKALGIDRTTLYRKMQRYRIVKDDNLIPE